LADLTTQVSQGGSFWVFKLSDVKTAAAK